MWIERLYDVINPAHLAFGSSANIVLHTRQASKAFDSLKTYWIWPTLHQLEPYKYEQRFLSTFLSLVDLGSFIDNRTLADHVGRTPVVQQYRPPSYMREMNAGYVIAELVKFLQGTEKCGIHAGMMFAQYVVAAFMIQFPTLKNTTYFLATFSLEKSQLRLQCYAGFWSLLQVLSLWRRHSNEGDHSTG
jgi:hypothetical protein